MAENRPLTEHVSGISPLRTRAIDGSPRPASRKPSAKPNGPQSSAVARRWTCRTCPEFVTADTEEANRHLYQHSAELARIIESGEIAGLPTGTAEVEERTSIPVADAVAAYLATLDSVGTARVYGQTLRGFAAAMAGMPDLLSVKPGMLSEWFTACWDNSAAATWNRNLSAMRAAGAYWADQGWTLRGNPADVLALRPQPKPRVCGISREDVMDILSGTAPIRERALWALLYEAAAAPADALALNVDDLDMRSRTAITKAGEIICWGDIAASLLAELVKGRRSGPVFLTNRRAKVPRARGDMHRGTGRGRLSYRSAADLLKEFSGSSPGGPWTLFQLRHAALTHAVTAGISVEDFMARSRIAVPRELSGYAS